MVLIDSSVWIEHFKFRNAGLIELLDRGQVLTHTLVIGEVACGSLANRVEIVELMQLLPRATETMLSETLDFIARHKLYGQGVGWIDVCILSASLLSQAKLWTRDKSLAKLAINLGVSYN